MGKQAVYIEWKETSENGFSFNKETTYLVALFNWTIKISLPRVEKYTTNNKLDNDDDQLAFVKNWVEYKLSVEKVCCLRHERGWLFEVTQFTVW